MRTIYVPLPEGALDGLRELARREYRGPKEQAAYLIVDGLRRAGVQVDVSSAERAALVPGRTRR